jgi:phytoene dehydrogenase-like protein
MRRWDVVILGANTSGILAGALLVKRGFSVLFLEEGGKAAKLRGKYRFRQFSNLSEIFISRAVIEGVYQLLGLRLADGEFAHRGNLKCQILLPGHRIDIAAYRTDSLDEMKREFPGNSGLIETFYSRLQEEDWIRRTMMALGDEQPLLGRIGKRLALAYHVLSDRRLSAFLGSLKADKAFTRFIDVQIKSMSYLYVDDWPLSLTSHLIGILMRDEVLMDVTSPRGFMDRVKEEAVKGGGKVNVLESFNRVHIEKSPGEFRIHTNGEDKTISSKVCIGNLPLSQLKKLMPTAFSGRKWAGKEKRLWPKYFILSLNLGLDARGVPVGLGDCFVSLRDMDAPYENGNLLIVLMGPEGVGAPSGKKSVTVNAFIPVDEGKWDRAKIKGVIENMLVHLLEVAPFLDRSIRLIDGRPSLGRYGGQWANRDIIYGGVPSFRMGGEMLPTATPVEGLFLACRENVPYLGFEGEILSGIKVTRAISNRFR